MKILPRMYRNLKWSLVPENIIDTVVTKPIANLTAVEPQVIATRNITNGYVNNVPVTFPITNETYDNVLNFTWNNYYAALYGSNTYASGVARACMASGSADIYVETPITGRVFAEIGLKGDSYVIARGSSTFANYPISDMSNVKYDLHGWIKGARTSAYNSLQWDYADNIFNVTPFVRNFTPFDINQRPTEADLYTKWWTDKSTWVMANSLKDNWYYGSHPASGDNEARAMFSPDSYVGDGGLHGVIYLKKLTQSFGAQATLIDEHNVHIEWTAPVRFSYAAASRGKTVIAGTDNQIDNYAITDIVNSLEITIKGTPYSTDVIDKSYGLSNGALTEVVSNEYPFKVDAGELFTLDSYYGTESNKWSNVLAKSILTNYEKGKYVVTLDIPAAAAIANALEVRSALHQIVLQDGATISHKGAPVDFYLVNITKRYTQQGFVYSLGFLEV